jgi:hypothetical protein
MHNVYTCYTRQRRLHLVLILMVYPIELYRHIFLPAVSSIQHTPSVEPPPDGLSCSAPVYQVWFGNGRVSGLSGSAPLFPICKDSKQWLVLIQPATSNLISGFLVSDAALMFKLHSQPLSFSRGLILVLTHRRASIR